MILEGIVLILSSIGLVQAIFLSFYLFQLKKGNPHANYLLAWILVGLTIRIGKSVIHSYIDLSAWQRNLGLSGIFIVGPFLWFYGQALLEKQKHTLAQNYWHLIPGLIFISIGFLAPQGSFLLSHSFGYGAVLLHLGIYLVWIWQYYRTIHEKFRLELIHWYWSIVVGISLIWLFYFGIYIRLIPFYLGGAIFYSILVYIFSYLLLQRHVFVLEKYPNSVIDRARAQDLLQELKILFREKEIYTQSNLSIQMMANQLSVSPRVLSQTINDLEGKNFSEFVNYYRIQKAKELLIHPKNAQDKIASIAYDCGFGNITSFNLAFKSETQLTPSQYKKQFKVLK